MPRCSACHRAWAAARRAARCGAQRLQALLAVTKLGFPVTKRPSHCSPAASLPHSAPFSCSQQRGTVLHTVHSGGAQGLHHRAALVYGSTGAVFNTCMRAQTHVRRRAHASLPLLRRAARRRRHLAGGALRAALAASVTAAGCLGRAPLQNNLERFAARDLGPVIPRVCLSVRG